MKITKVTCYLILVTLSIASFLISCNEIEEQPIVKNSTIDPVDQVYPQLDTENSRWFLFASANRPFGMVNLSPDTQLEGTWGSGYRYEIDTIKGFSHVHGWQLSGLSVMPVVIDSKNQKSIFKDFHSKFSHDEEEVSPGYHSVQLQRYGIKTELTSTKRVGFHRYTFKEGTKNAILLNLNGQFGPCETSNGKLAQISPTEFEGEFVVEPTSRKPKSNTVFFYITLNTPVEAFEKDIETGNYNLILTDTKEKVLMKASISYTSAKNAKKNMDAELPHWNFEEIVQESKTEWNDVLGRIKVEGGSDKAQKRFYTDLWHALQGRRTISDINGAYPD
ncbi:MAG: glycoside hydrolase domain-containing protein, partial [Maribacter sp.]